MLILGPSFKRRKDAGLLPAIRRYNGFYTNIALNWKFKAGDIDILIMRDDFTLIDAFAPLGYVKPEGNDWYYRKALPKAKIFLAKAKNEVFLKEKLSSGKYSEIFICMGIKYAKALPTMNESIKVIFPTEGGLGPKAHALKKWLCQEMTG